MCSTQIHFLLDDAGLIALSCSSAAAPLMFLNVLYAAFVPSFSSRVSRGGTLNRDTKALFF